MNNRDLWAVFFLSLVNWREHPGWTRGGQHPPSLEEMAELADQMLIITLRRFPWQEPQQQQPPQ